MNGTKRYSPSPVNTVNEISLSVTNHSFHDLQDVIVKELIFNCRDDRLDFRPFLTNLLNFLI